MGKLFLAGSLGQTLDAVLGLDAQSSSLQAASHTPGILHNQETGSIAAFKSAIFS